MSTRKKSTTPKAAKLPMPKVPRAMAPDKYEFVHTELDDSFEVIKEGFDGRQRSVKILLDKDGDYLVAVDQMVSHIPLSIEEINHESLSEVFDQYIANTGVVG